MLSTDQLKLINAGVPVRVLLIVVTVLVLYGSYRAACWYIGSEIALAAPQLLEEAGDAAETGLRLSPDDPMSHRGLAAVAQRSVLPSDVQMSVAEFERAVSLSPRDFRLWIDLGRAREQAGDFAGSEKALRRATELAPLYSWPRWHLGNFLLRRGRYEEAFAELRRAAEADPTKRSMIFDLAWMVYGGDSKEVKGVLGNSAEVRAEFVTYLLGRGRLDEALQLWSSLTGEEKRESSDAAKALLDSLAAAKRYRTALELSRDMMGGQSPFGVGQITNPSFESPVSLKDASMFDWHVMNMAQARTALDHVAHNGNYGLRVDFNSPGMIEYKITQLVAVEPGSHYRLQFYVRKENLKSAAMPIAQILTVAGASLAESKPLTPGKGEWEQFDVEFKTPPDVDGIVVQISREPCTSVGTVCPIFGTVWYDDFNLQLIGRDAAAKPNSRRN